MSVPNQKILIITKSELTMPPFLQISQEDWQAAYKELSPSSFAVYLYMAQNKNGYHFEFSPTAIANTGIMSKGKASKARQELEEKGYIEDGHFYVESRSKRIAQKNMKKEISQTI